MSYKQWKQLAQQCETMKINDQHHQHMQAVQWSEMEETADKLEAMGTYCPKDLAADCPFTFLGNYVKK